nr:hypothetical protein [Acetobacter persici]
MSKIPASVCANQAVTLDGIQSALIMLMGELYEHMDEGHDPAPTHNDCAGWGDGLSWLAKSIARVRDELREVKS